MGKNEKLVIVKLGGSVITNKEKPLSPNLQNIRRICRELSRIIVIDKQIQLFLIHGGGSFGHYYAKKFGLGTSPVTSASPEGLARTSATMIELHSLILEELCRAGVYCATILPSELFQENGVNSLSGYGRKRVQAVFENHLVPITFGFVNFEGSESFIVSGDKIAISVANAFDVQKTIFIMNVDGIFQASDLKGGIFRELDHELLPLESTSKGFDVTGGVKAKISAGFEISKLGSEVYFLNGTKSNRLYNALRDNNVIATKIYPMKKPAPYLSK
jgi:isopentenyl phosphate kinase